jgi:hypothetical protein
MCDSPDLRKLPSSLVFCHCSVSIGRNRATLSCPVEPVAPGSCRPGARPWLLPAWAAGWRVSIRGVRWREAERGRVCSAAGRLVLLAVNQASLLSLASPACQATAGSSWLPVRIQALAVSAGTTVTVTGLRRMPVDIAVRSVCSLGWGVPGNRGKLTARWDVNPLICIQGSASPGHSYPMTPLHVKNAGDSPMEVTYSANPGMPWRGWKSPRSRSSPGNLRASPWPWQSRRTQVPGKPTWSWRRGVPIRRQVQRRGLPSSRVRRGRV